MIEGYRMLSDDEIIMPYHFKGRIPYSIPVKVNRELVGFTTRQVREAGLISESRIFLEKIAEEHSKADEWVEIGIDSPTTDGDIAIYRGANRSVGHKTIETGLPVKHWGGLSMKKRFPSDLEVARGNWSVFRRTSQVQKGRRRLPANKHYSKPLPLP